MALPADRTLTPRGGAFESRLVALLTACLFALLSFALIRPFFSSIPWMTLAQDDFFYYLVVARNIVQGHGSTFNGIVPTNGYQPLYLSLVTAFSLLPVTPRTIVGFLAGMNLLASAATFLLARILIRRTGVRPLMVFALAALVTVTSFGLFCTGMEVVLTVPLVLGVLVLMQKSSWLERKTSHAFWFGLLLSAMVLSRIDTLILAGMLLIGVIASRDLRTRLTPKLVLGMSLGLLPVVLYFLSNRMLFHTWLPVSGMAKELRLSPSPSLVPLRMLLVYHSLMLLRFFAVIFAALALLPSAFKKLSAMERVMCVSVLLFPFAYYTTLCFLSDWPLWPWYWYPLRIAACVSCLIFCRSGWLASLLQRPLVAAVLMVAAFGELAAYGWQRDGYDVDDAEKVAEFAAVHPGIYAMGDRSGRVGYLVHSPIVHLEGLMMDRTFLSYISAESPLRTVLDKYDVRYYIATSTFPYTGCFEAVEPFQAGVLSPHMRDEFCETPVFRFTHTGRETLVFDLHPHEGNAP